MSDRRRFEALEVPAGWTVVDLHEDAIAVTKGRWDEATAVMVADTLNALPGYAVEWDWSTATDECSRAAAVGDLEVGRG